MTPRSLFEVVIRLFGALCFFTTAYPIVQTAVIWFAPYLGFDILEGIDIYVAQQLVSTLFTGVLGLVLFCYAPQIAFFVYPIASNGANEAAERTVVESRFGPEDIYRVFFVAFGLSLLTQSVEPMSYLVIDLFMRGSSIGLIFTTMDSQITQVLVNTAVGFSLIFWSGRMAKLLAAENDQAPKQTKSKLNFAMAVVLLFLFAVFLAIIRLLVLSQA